jgi:hypothetical protein
VWRTEAVWRVAPGPGKKPDFVVRAHIEIPEQKVTVRLSLWRNDDKQLPASHIVEILFTLPPDFPHGGISNVPGLLMKQGETTRGVPLNAVAVKVTDNFFLIGLSSVDADVQRNVQLLKERSWFDIPVVYSDGKRAIIAVEKATPSVRALAVLEPPAGPEPTAKPQRWAALPPAPGPAIVIAGDKGGVLRDYYGVRQEFPVPAPPMRPRRGRLGSAYPDTAAVHWNPAVKVQADQRLVSAPAPGARRNGGM